MELGTEIQQEKNRKFTYIQIASQAQGKSNSKRRIEGKFTRN